MNTTDIVDDLLATFFSTFLEVESQFHAKKLSLEQSQQHSLYDLWGRYLALTNPHASALDLSSKRILTAALILDFHAWLLTNAGKTFEGSISKLNVALDKIQNLELSLDRIKICKKIKDDTPL